MGRNEGESELDYATINLHPSGNLEGGLVSRRGSRGERSDETQLKMSRDLKYVLGEGRDCISTMFCTWYRGTGDRASQLAAEYSCPESNENARFRDIKLWEQVGGSRT